MKINNVLAASRRKVHVALALSGAVLAFSAPATLAAIVDSGTISIPAPATAAGIYLNVVTGANAVTPAGAPGWDLNPYATGGNLGFFTSTAPANTNAVVLSGGVAAALALGNTVGPGNTYTAGGTAGTAGTAFRTTATSFVGFRFNNELTGIINYGYMQISTTAPTGFPATITRYVYENTGQAITIANPPNLFRTYLDPSGNDSNPCNLSAPCRLLPAALAAVVNGGEVWMLDSANYNNGPVNIPKSVTILAVPGAVGSLVAAGGNALDITTPNVKVALRNLVIVPLVGGGGTNGINMTAGAGLTLENCLVAGVPGIGISVNAAASVWITDTTIRDNGGDGVFLQNGARATLTRTRISGNAATGVFMLGSIAGTTTIADIADSTVDGNSFGVYVKSANATALMKASVRGSQIVRHSGDGVTAESGGGAATLAVSGNIISNNGTGIRAFLPAARVWASGNTVSDNGLGLHNDGGVVESGIDNTVSNNATATVGAITAHGLQ